jgi:hypothetical protein
VDEKENPNGETHGRGSSNDAFATRLSFCRGRGWQARRPGGLEASPHRLRRTGALATPSGGLLPLAELAVGCALMPAVSAWWGALGALALMLLFAVGIAINLTRGRKPDCHCFGQLHSSPAGWKTLGRDGALAAVAGFVVWQGTEDGVGPSAVGWLGTLSGAQSLGLISGTVLAGIVAGMW